jgi:transcriptional regulator with XRE-family HTH domain
MAIFTPPPENGKYSKPIRYLNDGVNRNKLREVIRAKGETQTRIAAAYGKHNALISNKLNGRAPFMAKDISFLFRYLNLTPAEAAEIFFSGNP